MVDALLTAAAVASGLAIGFVPTLVDRVRAPLAKQLKSTERRVERTLAIFYLAWLPAMPLAGWLLDHWRNKEVLFFGLLGCVLGTAWLGLAQTTRSVAGSVAALGVSYSAVAVAGIRLMPAALAFGPRSSTVAALNVGFVFVIVGAVAGPWLVDRAERRFGHRQGLLYLSLVLLVFAALAFLVPREQYPDLAESMSWVELAADVRLGLMAVVVLLYFALENCLEVWPDPYLKEIGYHGRPLTAAVLIFWGAFTATRLVTGWLPGTGYEVWLLLGLVLASGFTMGNLVGANEYGTGGLGFWLTGACYGPLLPGFLALTMDFFPRLPGTALGMMLALSGLDTLIVRPLMTALARYAPARTVMRVPAVLALVLAAPLLVLALTASPAGPRDRTPRPPRDHRAPGAVSASRAAASSSSCSRVSGVSG